MDVQNIANIVLAATVTHAMHSMIEPVNIRAKVARLTAYMDKKPYKETPMNIDTRAKSYGIGFGLVLVIFAVAFAITNAINPAPRNVLLITLGLIVLIELVNTVTIDKYHVEIEKVTRRFKK